MKSRKSLKLLTILLPVLGLVLYLTKDWYLRLLPFIPPCPFYTTFDLYCPACGNTRSTLALLQGDVVSSLRYNIIPVLLIILALLSYAELAFSAFGKRVLLLPRKLSFYLLLIGILIIYFILRNYFPYFTP